MTTAVDETYNDCISAIENGFKSFDKFCKQYKKGRSTVANHLKEKKTSWTELKKQYSPKNRPSKSPDLDDKKSPHPTPQNTSTSHKFTSSSTPGQGDPLPSTSSFLSPFIREVMSIQSQFVAANLQCNVKDAIELRTQAMQYDGMKDIPAWSRPAVLNNKQNLIIDDMLNRNIQVVAVEGDKRVGKSTAWFNAVCEGVWSAYFKKIGVWASGADNAIGILNDVFTDKLTMQHTFPLFKGTGSRTQKVFFNNAVIQAHSNNVGSTSGLDFDCVVIDECHQVIVDCPEIFAMVAMTLRAKPDLKIILVMNMGTAPYLLFKKKLMENIPEEKFRFHTLLKDDTTHISEESDLMVRTLVEASTGKAEAARWLDNKANLSGSSFNAQSIMAAYDSYEAFLGYSQLRPFYKVMGFDPSGAGHPMGWFIGACDANGSAFWELESGELQLGEDIAEIDGEKFTPAQIRAYLLMKAKHYHITHFVCESNMNGKEMKLEFQLAGYQAFNQNFTTDKNQKKGASRGAMIHVARDIMDDRAMFLKGEILQDNLGLYNPDEHEKTAKFKGDVADAFLHTIYKLARLSRSPYLHKKKYKIYTEVSAN